MGHQMLGLLRLAQSPLALSSSWGLTASVYGVLRNPATYPPGSGLRVVPTGTTVIIPLLRTPLRASGVMVSGIGGCNLDYRESMG